MNTVNLKNTIRDEGSTVPKTMETWLDTFTLLTGDGWMERMGHTQSQKNPVSASAMLTGKFLGIRKVFATCSLLAEEFPDNLENSQMLHKISR